MRQNLRFWTNVTLVGLAHVVVIVGLIRWSRAEKDANGQSVMWMSGGAGDGIVAEKPISPPPLKLRPRTESKTDSPKLRDAEEDRPVLTSAPSEIQLPTPKPSPTSSATPPRGPKASPPPKPKPTPAASPSPTPKLKPKPSPKKTTLAKASPKPAPKAKAASEAKDEEQDKRETAEAEKKKIVLAKNEPIEAKPVPAKSPATQTGSGKGTTAGAGGGRIGGSTNESQFGWYGSMLHDRFYSEWVQPTSVASSGAKNSVLVKLRIEKDGRVSSFEVVRPSGNAELDESVKALANRVNRVDPLPDGLGKGDHYDVKINFELNSE
jgi:TonB family protein